MDMKQEEITTLHDLHLDKEKLMKNISDVAAVRPVSVVLPMLYIEIKSDENNFPNSNPNLLF